MSYGFTPYGLSPYGGMSTSITIVRAWATATHVVRVEVSSPARASDGFDDGDALNPRTWLIKRLDTGQVFTPIYVTKANAQGTAFEIRTIEPFGSHFVMHRISTFTLLGSNGMTITAPYEFDFPGAVRTIDPVKAARRRPLVRDLANPFRVDQRTGTQQSAIIVDSDRDYAAETDARVVYKGILRRITTARDSIRGLKGYGLTFITKATVPQGGDIDALNAEVESQARQEPGVKRCRAGVEILGADVTRIRVRARLVGAQIEVSARRAADGSFVEL